MGQVAVVFFVPAITGAQNVTGRLGRAPTVKWVPMVTAAICVQIMCWDQNALSVSLAIGDCQKMVAEVPKGTLYTYWLLIWRSIP